MYGIFAQYSKKECQLALDCVYDSMLYHSNSAHSLVQSVRYDADMRNFLHLLAACDWDLVLATFKWSGEP